MLIDEGNAIELKIWVIKKLENISDADSDVLADYVIALLRADLVEPDLRRNAIESLEDFLKGNTTAFVDEVFNVLQTKSYQPGRNASRAESSTASSLTLASAPSGAYGSLGAGRDLHGGLLESRKRSYNDRQADGEGIDRQMKQTRRGGRASRADSFGGRNTKGGFQETNHPYARPPPVPPAFPNMQLPPPFDPSDPLAAMIAMQAMGLPPLPGMPPLSQVGSPNGYSQLGGQSLSPSRRRTSKERCRDYDDKGYCARGNACPYEHGTDRLIVPGQDEYDPKNSNLVNVQPISPTRNVHGLFQGNRGNAFARGSARSKGDRGGFLQRRNNNRADFSQAGPNHDRSITTIVVEQIPEEKFDEQSVRDFFTDFGKVVEVTMQPYKRLALVKYDDYAAARRAYDSPKVIFDNRFVKVYWYNPNSLPTPSATAIATTSLPTTTKGEEQLFDREKFERDALAAQKKLEEKKAQMKEMEEKRQALEKQKEELAQKQAEEKRKLLEKLAAKGIVARVDTPMTDAPTNGTNGADDSKVSAHTKALREKLAELEAEAKSLGLDSALSDPPYAYRGRGRGRGRGGSYRGWEGFASQASRGAGYESFRGSLRGRGPTFGGVRGSGKYNLDNRTKKVAVSGVDFAIPENDEALRQYLLGVGEFEAIETHPNRPDTQIITFKDRPTAETFMYGSKDIPGVGKLESSFFNPPSVSSLTTAKQGANGDAGTGPSSTDGENGGKGTELAAEVDWDVADDEDWK